MQKSCFHAKKLIYILFKQQKEINYNRHKKVFYPLSYSYEMPALSYQSIISEV